MAFIVDYAAHLVGMIARGESISGIDTTPLSRDRIKILRRMQAGLSAGTVATEPRAVVAHKRTVRRANKSLRCSCKMCRAGCDTLCERA